MGGRGGSAGAAGAAVSGGGVRGIFVAATALGLSVSVTSLGCGLLLVGVVPGCSSKNEFLPPIPPPISNHRRRRRPSTASSSFDADAAELEDDPFYSTEDPSIPATTNQHSREYFSSSLPQQQYQNNTNNQYSDDYNNHYWNSQQQHPGPQWGSDDKRQRRLPFASSSSTANNNNKDARRVPPPPPLPPIHYLFPATTNTEITDRDGDAELPLATTTITGSSKTDNPRFASPRQTTTPHDDDDRVDQFKHQSRRHAWTVTGSAALVGYSLAAGVGQAATGRAVPPFVALASAGAFGAVSVVDPHGATGSWMRAVGLWVWWTATHYSTQIRREYPTMRYAVASVARRNKRRNPNNNEDGRYNHLFPPIVNPWAWENGISTALTATATSSSSSTVVEFYMLYSVLAMAWMGAIVGAAVAASCRLPSSLGGVVGAAAGAYTTTLSGVTHPVSNVARCMGMRIVATVLYSLSAQKSLQLGHKTARLSSKLLDKILILDRQHSIRDKIGAAFTNVYETVLLRMQKNASPTSSPMSSNPRRRQQRSYMPTDPLEAADAMDQEENDNYYSDNLRQRRGVDNNFNQRRQEDRYPEEEEEMGQFTDSARQWQTDPRQQQQQRQSKNGQHQTRRGFFGR